MTAAACSQSECEGCEIEGKLLCVHKPKDLIDFYVLFTGWAIPFFAGMIIGKFWVGITVWVVLAIIFFGYIEALILCRHCPHYAEDGFLLRCHANWGLPKIPKLKPQPMNSFEKVGPIQSGQGPQNVFYKTLDAGVDGHGRYDETDRNQGPVSTGNEYLLSAKFAKIRLIFKFHFLLLLKLII